MISKVIHYVWLGKKPKSAIINICINSWRERLPEFQIIEWNEDNLDLDKLCNENRFFRECRRRNMWAFMADYIRVKLLYEHGGIYLDTDVQILKDLTPLLNSSYMMSMETDEYIGTGLIGAEPSLDFFKTMLKFYEHEIWELEIYTIPQIITHVMNSGGYKSNIPIYPKEYFSPLHYNDVFVHSMIKENTYAIHWFCGSWGKKIKEVVFLQTKHIHNPIVKTAKASRIIARTIKERFRA